MCEPRKAPHMHSITATGPGKPLNRVTEALKANGRQNTRDMWQCPAHDDIHPSLRVRPANRIDGVIVKCFAGCETADVMAALNLTMADLFNNPAPELSPVRQICATLTRRGETYPWPGRAGRNHRDGFLAIVDRANQIDAYDMHMSCRELAPLAGFGKDAASTTLRWLADNQCIRFTRPARKLSAREIRLLPTALTQVDENPTLLYDSPIGSRKTSVGISTPAYDLTRSELAGVAGKTGIAVYLALTTEPQTRNAIAGAAGVSRDTATRKLRGVLRDLGLAEPDIGGWVKGARDPATYDPATESLCGPIVATRIARYAKETMDYINHPVRCRVCGKMEAYMDFPVCSHTCAAEYDARKVQSGHGRNAVRSIPAVAA